MYNREYLSFSTRLSQLYTLHTLQFETMPSSERAKRQALKDQVRRSRSLKYFLNKFIHSLFHF